MIHDDFDPIFRGDVFKLFRLFAVKTDDLLKVRMLARNQCQDISQTDVRAKQSGHLCLIENDLKHVIPKSLIQWHRGDIYQIASQISD